MSAAVVTGAAMGIGRAIAARLIADGVHVVALDLNGEALESAAAELGDRFEPVVGDVGDWAAHERAADAAQAAGDLAADAARRAGDERAGSLQPAHQEPPSSSMAG